MDTLVENHIVVEERRSMMVSKTICSKCRYAIQDILEMFCMYRKLHTKDGLFKNCHCFSPKSVFDHITASPEVLAEKSVYQNYIGLWCSPFIQWGKDTKEEAIAETVARLKEVYNV
jgi:hypothetical protein